MHGRQYRDRLPGHVHGRKNTCRLSDAWKAFLDDVGAEVLEVQVNMVFVRADTAAFANFDRHRAADDIARGQVLGVRRIALHEALTGRVRQVTSLTTHTLRDQHPRTVDSGWVKLHELHILNRQPGAQHHSRAVTRAGVRRGTGKIGAPITAGCQNDLVRPEPVQAAIGQIQSDNTTADALLHDQVDCEILDEEFCIMLQRLLVKRMQHGMAGAVCRGTGSLCRALTEVRGHATERALIDFAGLGARKRHTVMFQFDDGSRCFLAHVLYRVLIAEPVRALYGVVHMPAPVILSHVAQRRTDAALRGHRVATRRKHLADACRFETGFRQSEGRPQSSAAGTDDDNIIRVINEGIIAHADAPSEIISTA